jgi:hypothetical protein
MVRVEPELGVPVVPKSISIGDAPEHKYPDRVVSFGNIVIALFPNNVTALREYSGLASYGGLLGGDILGEFFRYLYPYRAFDIVGGRLTEVLDPQSHLLGGKVIFDDDRIISGRDSDVRPKLGTARQELPSGDYGQEESQKNQEECRDGRNGVATFHYKDGGTFSVSCERIAEVDDSMWHMLLAIGGCGCLWWIYTRIKGAR